MSAAKTNEAVQRQFGAVASAYATSAVHASGPDLIALIAAARLTGSERVLDMGCGAGHVSLAVAPKAAAVTAVDLTPEMLEVTASLAKQRGVSNIATLCADVVALPLEDVSFDLVLSRYSAHHYAEPGRALSEAWRLLRPGGRFLLVDTVAPEDGALDTFFNSFELIRDPSHVRNWRASEWVRMATAAGFESRVLERFGIRIEGPSWVQRAQTPPWRATFLKQLFTEATGHQRAAFEVEDDPWAFSIPVTLIEATKPAV